MAITGPGSSNGIGAAQAARSYSSNQPQKAAVNRQPARQAIQADTADIRDISDISPEARRASRQGVPASTVQTSPAAQAVTPSRGIKSIDVLIS